MCLKEGDKITLTVSPTIQVVPFQFLKASASVQRTLTADIEKDLEETKQAVEQLYLHNVEVELGLFTSVLEAVEMDGIDGIKEWCAEEIKRYGNKKEVEQKTKTRKPRRKPKLKA